MDNQQGQCPQTLFEAQAIYENGVADGLKKALGTLIQAPASRTLEARRLVGNQLAKQVVKLRGKNDE